jgi:hypothetical protein
MFSRIKSTSFYVVVLMIICMRHIIQFIFLLVIILLIDHIALSYGVYDIEIIFPYALYVLINKYSKQYHKTSFVQSLNKYISSLIILSFKHQNPLRGLDALLATF